jgi:hypothetical protein
MGWKGVVCLNTLCVTSAQHTRLRSLPQDTQVHVLPNTGGLLGQITPPHHTPTRPITLLPTFLWTSRSIRTPGVQQQDDYKKFETAPWATICAKDTIWSGVCPLVPRACHTTVLYNSWRLPQFTSHNLLSCRLIRMLTPSRYRTLVTIMAEVAGLTIGVVALASLFSTCIECIEYYERRESYEHDYQLACLKLSLLKSRLKALGQDLGIYDDKDDLKEDGPWHYEPYETTVIHESLRSIAEIFRNAGLLESKHRLKSRKTRRISVEHVFPRMYRRSAPSDAYETTSRRQSTLAFLQRSTTWAIRDKHKLDDIITELAFLISNLEVIVARLHTDSMSSTKEKKKGQRLTELPVHSNMANRWGHPDNAAANVSSLIPRKKYLPPAIASTSKDSYSLAVRKESRRHDEFESKSKSESDNGNQESDNDLEDRSDTTQKNPTQLTIPQGYSYENGTVDSEAKLLQGPQGAAFKAMPAGNTASFNTTLITGKARVVNGTLGPSEFKAFFD